MNGFESYQKCPKCGETKNILTEKRPFGDSRCRSCGFKAKTLLFAVPKKEDKQTLEVKFGRVYLTSDGCLIKIVSRLDTKDLYIGSNRVEYNSKGHDIRDNKDNDLIAEIPESLHFELLRVINEYYTNRTFKHFIDKSYKEGINA